MAKSLNIWLTSKMSAWRQQFDMLPQTPVTIFLILILSTSADHCSGSQNSYHRSLTEVTWRYDLWNWGLTQEPTILLPLTMCFITLAISTVWNWDEHRNMCCSCHLWRTTSQHWRKIYIVSCNRSRKIDLGINPLYKELRSSTCRSPQPIPLVSTARLLWFISQHC